MSCASGSVRSCLAVRRSPRPPPTEAVALGIGRIGLPEDTGHDANGEFGARGNAGLLRALNERSVLRILRRRGTLSKTEIAEAVGLSTNTVGLICGALMRQGLIKAGEKRQGLRGQPATPLSLDPAGAFAIGVKFGRRTQRAVLVDFAGTVLHARSRVMDLPMPEDALALIAGDVRALEDLLPAGSRARLRGVGIAMPYNLDRWRRELDIPDRIGEAWCRFDLHAELAAIIDTSIVVENDGTAAVAAELYQGCGHTLDDFALVHIGAALGGGLVLDGVVRRGRSGNAADFGLMPVGPSRLASRPKPPASLPDILLNRASLHALLRHLRAGGLDVRLSRDLDGALDQRPDVIDEWLDDCVDALVRPIYALTALLDLQAIVLGGLLPGRLMEHLVHRLDARLTQAAPEARRPPRLVLGTAGRDAAAVGAAYLMFAQAFDAISEARPGGDTRPANGDSDSAL